MKSTLLLVISLLALACAPCCAMPLEEADVPKDLQSILTGFRFISGDSSWKSNDLELSSTLVSSGSAYCIFEEPSPAPSDYPKLAAQIRDGFGRLYELKAASSGGGGVQGANSSENSGMAHFTWTDVHGNTRNSKESISMTVRVVPLRDGKIGVILGYVHVRPRAWLGDAVKMCRGVSVPKGRDASDLVRAKAVGRWKNRDVLRGASRGFAFYPKYGNAVATKRHKEHKSNPLHRSVLTPAG